MQELGVTSSREIWIYKDHAKLVRGCYGRLNNMFRVDHALAELLELMDQQEWSLAHAYTVQLRKTILQVGLDQGDWRRAALLLPTQGPMKRVEFAGQPQELQAIHKHTKALRELREGIKKQPAA